MLQIISINNATLIVSGGLCPSVDVYMLTFILFRNRKSYFFILASPQNASMSRLSHKSPGKLQAAGQLRARNNRYICITITSFLNDTRYALSDNGV